VAVSFPHYFLQVTGNLAEQLKTREWFLARITSILELVVEPNVRTSCQCLLAFSSHNTMSESWARLQDPESNPYGLGNGVKYYMLQVEDWSQPRPSKRPSRVPAAGAREDEAGVSEE
jgi:autophagy-related protein 11